MKVVLQYAATPALRARLAALESAALRIVAVPEGQPGLLRREIAEAEVLWHVLEPVTAELLAAAPRLRLIQKIGVGVNTIDLAAAQARGIAVANMPGTNSQAVAEHTLMLMLATLRRAASIDRMTRAGAGWSFDRETLDHVGELCGRTVGLVGFGAVARLLAPVCAALGARVRHTSTRRKDDGEWPWMPLDELIATSDVLSLHLPLTPATTRLLDARRIAGMRPGAILVNTARGGLVDEAALIEALRTGRLGGAGLDVFASEPVDPANPLLALENVVVSPHIAWLTPETLQRSLGVAADNVRRLGAGEPLLHRVV